jgi:hypothetical protein
MAECATAVLEKCSSIWKGMMAKAKKEGYNMSDEEMVQVRKDILKEALIRELVAWSHYKNAERGRNRSVDAGLLATPAGYAGMGNLDFLSSATISSLMEKGWGVEEKWMGRSVQEGIMKELEALHHNPCSKRRCSRGSPCNVSDEWRGGTSVNLIA